MGILQKINLVAVAIAVACLFTTPAFAKNCESSLNANQLTPDKVVGKGPNGSDASKIDAVKLTDGQAKKVRAGNFEVAVLMQTRNLDWSRLQIKGMRDTFNKYGVKISNIISADYDVAKQISDIENAIQTKPDGIISVPVDRTATAPAFAKVAKEGIKLVFADNVPKGLKHPKDYASRVSADNKGNGIVAAEILSCYVPKGGTVGIVNYGVDYYTTNLRTKGVKEWFGANRPDVKIKQVNFTDPSKVSRVAGNFITAHPGLNGLFAVWSRPALDTISAMRAQGVHVPITTTDLGLESAVEMAHGESSPLKGLGAQDPYKQGKAEALAMMHALIGDTPPAWIGIKAIPTLQTNVLEIYQRLFNEKPPENLVSVCKSNKICG